MLKTPFSAAKTVQPIIPNVCRKYVNVYFIFLFSKTANKDTLNAPLMMCNTYHAVIHSKQKCKRHE